MLLRTMGSTDLNQLVAIDAAVNPSPWSWLMFNDCFTAGDPCYVLEIDQQVAGFAIYKRVLDEVSLLNIAVDPQFQRRGYGRRLLQQSLDQAADGARCCFLEVRESNAAAIYLYRDLGFEQVGERRNYYPAGQGREHARVMRLEFTNEQAG